MIYMNFQKKEKINIKIKKLLKKRKKYKIIKKKKKKSFKKKIILIHLTLKEKGKKS